MFVLPAVFVRDMGPQKKVLLLTDSHGRHCSSLLQKELGGDYLVSGFVMPGAPLSEVVRGAPALARDADVVVILAGTNDVVSPESGVDFGPLLNVLPELVRPVVILNRLPPRFDNRHLNLATQRINSDFPEFSQFENIMSPELWRTSFFRPWELNSLAVLAEKLLAVNNLSPLLRVVTREENLPPLGQRNSKNWTAFSQGLSSEDLRFIPTTRSEIL